MRTAPTLAAVLLTLTLVSQAANASPSDDLARLDSDYESLKHEFDDLGSKVDDYIAGSRKLREFDNDEITKLIIHICNLDVKRDDDEEDRIVKSLTDKAQSDVAREYDTTASTGKDWQYKVAQLQDKLKSTAYYVEPYKDMDETRSDASSLYDQINSTRDRAARMYDQIDADLNSLENVKNGTMNGSNNPRIRAAMDWGKAKHVYNQRICDKKEITLSSGRPDCITFNRDECTVWEFKPSSVGESAARSQAERYLSDVARYFRDDPRAQENCKKDSDGNPIFEARGQTYPACTPND
jgi:hypothetical protein